MPAFRRVSESSPSVNIDDWEHALIAKSRADQGLPPKISDPAVVQVLVDAIRAVHASADADRMPRARQPRRHAKAGGSRP